MKRFRDITITHASNGLITRVGCYVLVYQQTQLNMFHDDLASYINNPHEIEKEIRKRWHIDEDVNQGQPEEPIEVQGPTRERIRAAEDTEKVEEAPRV